MKIRVTQLKAPWPDGTAVGAVLDLPGDALPAWAVGKCEQAPEQPAAAAAAEQAPEQPAEPKAKGKK